MRAVLIGFSVLATGALALWRLFLFVGSFTCSWYPSTSTCVPDAFAQAGFITCLVGAILGAFALAASFVIGDAVEVRVQTVITERRKRTEPHETKGALSRTEER